MIALSKGAAMNCLNKQLVKLHITIKKFTIFVERVLYQDEDLQQNRAKDQLTDR